LLKQLQERVQEKELLLLLHLQNLMTLIEPQTCFRHHPLRLLKWLLVQK
jgi:hypothetical protein